MKNLSRKNVILFSLLILFGTCTKDDPIYIDSTFLIGKPNELTMFYLLYDPPIEVIASYNDFSSESFDLNYDGIDDLVLISNWQGSPGGISQLESAVNLINSYF